MAVNNLTEQHAAVTMSVRGADGASRNLGVWDSADEPKVSSDVTKHRGGGTRQQKAFVGLGEYDDAKLARPYSDDIAGFWWLSERAEFGADVTLGFQDLDVDGNAFGRPRTYVGKLKEVDPGKVDSNSTDPRMVEATVVITHRKVR